MLFTYKISAINLMIFDSQASSSAKSMKKDWIKFFINFYAPYPVSVLFFLIKKAINLGFFVKPITKDFTKEYPSPNNLASSSINLLYLIFSEDYFFIRK
jgi:hypothetical protein